MGVLARVVTSSRSRRAVDVLSGRERGRIWRKTSKHLLKFSLIILNIALLN